MSDSYDHNLGEEMVIAGRGDDGLDEMDIAQLRKYAKLYQVSISRDFTALDIRNAIRNKMKNKEIFVEAAGDEAPKPGYTRVKLLQDTSIGNGKAGRRPVYVHVNGYKCTVPRGVAVDVPHKVAAVLRSSYHLAAVEDPDNAGRHRFERVPSYPFEVLGSTPGPDPKPGFERQKASSYGPRVKFRDMFGHWPKKTELNEAIKEGFIKLERPVPTEPTN